jgi:hypothetical protein
MDYIATTFNLGTSTVLTIPKKLGLSAGVKTVIKKLKSGFLVKPITSDVERNIAIIRKLAGSNKNKFTLTPDEMNRLYDKGVYEKVLPRR